MNITDLLSTQGFKEICNTNEKVLDFIHKIKHREHCILIFSNEDKRDEIVSEFINPKFVRNAVTACFTHNPAKYNCNHEITYDKLIQNKKFLPQVISDFLVTVLDESYNKNSTRIACEDTAWLSEEGFFEEHQKFGKSMDKQVLEESSILCCYNKSKLDEEKMKVVLSSGKYIILEKPFSIYEKKDF